MIVITATYVHLLEQPSCTSKKFHSHGPCFFPPKILFLCEVTGQHKLIFDPHMENAKWGTLLVIATEE